MTMLTPTLLAIIAAISYGSILIGWGLHEMRDRCRAARRERVRIYDYEREDDQ